MIAEAIQTIEKNAARRLAAEVRTVNIPDLAPGLLAALVRDGDVEGKAIWDLKTFDYPRAPQVVNVDSPGQLDAFLGDRLATIFVDAAQNVVVAYHRSINENPIAQVVGNDYSLCDQVVCHLKRAETWEYLKDGFKGEPEEILRVQKLHFAGYQYKEGLPPNGTVIEAIDVFCRTRLKKVKMSVTKTVQSSLAPGADSMGSDVTRQALGGEDADKADWPDFVACTGSVFDRVDVEATVNMLLGFNHGKNALSLTPVPDDVLDAEDKAVKTIMGLLNKPNRVLVRGMPQRSASHAAVLNPPEKQ